MAESKSRTADPSIPRATMARSETESVSSTEPTSRDMARKMERRRGPRQGQSREVPLDLTAECREFRRHTEGLSNRLPLASVEQMRAGTVANPYSLARRYLYAGKRLGLPKTWGLRFAVWARRQVDALWIEAHTPRLVLEVKATQAEGVDDLHEKMLDAERSLARYDARIESLTAEIAADHEALAALQIERQRVADEMEGQQ